jgi:hypothetical protein
VLKCLPSLASLYIEHRVCRRHLQKRQKIKNVGGREGEREKEREGERERESERGRGVREKGEGGGQTWLAGPPRMFVGVIVCSVCAVVK